MNIFKPNIEKMKNKRDIKGLINALHDDRKTSGPISSEISVLASEALIELGDSSAVPGLIHVVEQAPATYSLIGDEAKSRRAAEKAIEVLGKLGDNRAVPVLIKALSKQFNLFLELHPAAEALGQIGDPSAIPALTSALNSPNEALRKGATKALEKLR